MSQRQSTAAPLREPCGRPRRYSGAPGDAQLPDESCLLRQKPAPPALRLSVRARTRVECSGLIRGRSTLTNRSEKAVQAAFAVPPRWKSPGNSFVGRVDTSTGFAALAVRGSAERSFG